MKGINIFLAPGFEDVEATGTFDALKRAGIDVRLVGTSEEPFVRSSHGITIAVDSHVGDLVSGHEGTDGTDIMIFPGGMPGTRNLASDTGLIRLMKEHYAAGGSLAAICAAPGLVLGQLDGLEGVEFTCFEGFQDLPVSKGAVYNPKPACSCETAPGRRIITGRSAGNALAFAFEIIRFLKGNGAVDKVRAGMYLEQ